MNYIIDRVGFLRYNTDAEQIVAPIIQQDKSKKQAAEAYLFTTYDDEFAKNSSCYTNHYEEEFNAVKFETCLEEEERINPYDYPVRGGGSSYVATIEDGSEVIAFHAVFAEGGYRLSHADHLFNDGFFDSTIDEGKLCVNIWTRYITPEEEMRGGPWITIADDACVSDTTGKNFTIPYPTSGLTLKHQSFPGDGQHKSSLICSTPREHCPPNASNQAWGSPSTKDIGDAAIYLLKDDIIIAPFTDDEINNWRLDIQSHHYTRGRDGTTWTPADTGWRQASEWDEYDRIVFNQYLPAGRYVLRYADDLFNQNRTGYPAGRVCFDIQMVFDPDIDMSNTLEMNRELDKGLSLADILCTYQIMYLFNKNYFFV